MLNIHQKNRGKEFLEHEFIKKVRRRKTKRRGRQTRPKNPNPNRIENLHRKYRRQAYRFYRVARNPKKFRLVSFPKYFSFINNTESVLESLEKARRNFLKGHQVEFDLSSIEELTPETIALFLACFLDKNFKRGLNARGNVPRKKELTAIFAESGFFNHVKSTANISGGADNILLNKITKFKVENEAAREACKKAVKNTFNNDMKFRPVYEILIECMANTRNHADISGVEGKYNWWLFGYNDTKSKISTFTFLDLGIGIFNSLPVKSFLRDISNKLRFTSNASLVGKLLGGEITSKTGLKERGLGLPLIFDHSKNPFIRNFRIISNDVHANLETGINQKLNYNFAGTFLYWELHPNPKP